MKSILLPFILLLFSGNLIAQSYLEVPVGVLVVFEKTSHDLQTAAGELTGIAMMMVFPSEPLEQITVNETGDALIRQEQPGMTNKTTIALSEQGIPLKFEFITTGHLTLFTCWYNSIKEAEGRLVHENGEYLLRLNRLNPQSPVAFKKALDAVNRYLMSLHFHERKVIPIQSHYISDTLNLVFGTDTQFDTANELYWFDRSLYEHLRTLSQETLSTMVGQRQNSLTQVLGQKKDIHHVAARQVLHIPTIKAQLKAHFKLASDSSLYFLRLGAEYEIELGYTAQRFSNGAETFKLDKISLKHLDTNDFVEMNILDLSNVGYNLLFVDLINGVVMSDQGTWDMQQVLEVIQDSFREMNFTNTYSIGASN